jgi:hypothetical protein
MQYLYLDENHSIVYNNGLTDLRVRMDDNLNFWCTNLSFPDLPESNFSEQMTIPYMLGIIDVLKKMPPIELPNAFSDRWKEIKTLTLTNVSLNKK